MNLNEMNWKQLVESEVEFYVRMRDGECITGRFTGYACNGGWFIFLTFLNVDTDKTYFVNIDNISYMEEL